jgi:hypothetical protein
MGYTFMKYKIAIHYPEEQTQKDKKGGARSTHGKHLKMLTEFYSDNLKEREHLRYLEMAKDTLLKRKWKRYNFFLWTGLNWSRCNSSERVSGLQKFKMLDNLSKKQLLKNHPVLFGTGDAFK